MTPRVTAARGAKTIMLRPQEALTRPSRPGETSVMLEVGIFNNRRRLSFFYFNVAARLKKLTHPWHTMTRPRPKLLNGHRQQAGCLCVAAAGKRQQCTVD